MGKILVCADIHGRQFWKEPCLNHVDEFDKIVFLGDFVSSYPYEGISKDETIDNFLEILDFKVANKDKVILLIGNHCFSYINSSICESRTDWENWDKLNEIYTEHIKYFDLAWETNINEKRYFFSHAGVRKGWLKRLVDAELLTLENINVLPNAEVFNNLLHVAYDNGGNPDVANSLEYCLGMYSTYRGYLGWDDGSIVWADIREYLDKDKIEYPDVRFICGHTQLESKPIIEDWVVDLDVRRPFVIDTDTGKIEEYGKEGVDRED